MYVFLSIPWSLSKYHGICKFDFGPTKVNSKMKNKTSPRKLQDFLLFFSIFTDKWMDGYIDRYPMSSKLEVYDVGVVL